MWVNGAPAAIVFPDNPLPITSTYEVLVYYDSHSKEYDARQNKT